MVRPSAPSPVPLSERLLDLAEALAAAGTPEEVERAVVQAASEALGAVAGAVLRVEAADERRARGGVDGQELESWPGGPLDGGVGGGGGPAADALRRREALYFEQEGELVRAYPELEGRTGGVSAVAALPLLLEGEPLGVLALALREPHVFPPEERRFLRSLAAQGALALGRVHLSATLHEQVRTRTRALESARAAAEVLTRLGDALQAAASPEEVARLALERLASTLDARGMNVVRLSGEQLQATAFWGEVPSGLRAFMTRPGLRLADVPNLQRVARTGTGLYFEDYAETPAPADCGAELSGAAEPVLTPRGRLVGFLVTWRPAGVQPWTPEQRDLHRRAAATLGRALARAEAEREREEERSALDAFVAYQEAVGTESDVYALARQAMQVVQAHLAHVSAAYYELEGGCWRGRVWTGDVDPEVVAQMQAGLPQDAPNLAEAARSGAAVFVDGWSATGESLPSAGMYGAAAFVPVTIRGEVRSIFAVGTREGRAWSEREQALVRAVVRGLSLTLERAAHTRQLEEQNAELDARTRALQGFADLSRDFAQHRDPDTLIGRALEMVLSLLPPGFALFYRPQGELWHATSRAGDVGTPELRAVVAAGLPVGATPTLDLPQRTREPLFQDVYDPARDVDPALVSHLYTVATLPVLVEGEVLGIFNVALFEARRWSAADRAVLETAVHSLGLALEGARGVEQLAQRTRELERSNAELEQFAYVASHDLQAPIRAVTSFAELIARRYSAGLDDRGRMYLGQIMESGEHMKRLVDDLLAFSRVHTGQKAPAPVASAGVFGAVRHRLLAQPGMEGASVTSGELPVVLADAAQLDQLLQNLIDNGLKYRREDVVPEVHVWAERERDFWRFGVRDNGIGIEPQYFGRIFEIFQRLHGRERYEGTGIGLAVCKKIVERHGGRLWVESEVGRGTTFFFTLPAA